VQIAGDFDDAMQRVQQVARKLGIYLVNSINPFRLEGQKTIMYRVLEALAWEPPDWIVVPGGNLGNVSAFGKAFIELLDLGLLKPPTVTVASHTTDPQLFEDVLWQRGVKRASFATRAVQVPNNLDEIIKAIEVYS